MTSCSFEFYPEKIKILSDGYDAAFPYSGLYRVYENDAIFLLYLGIGEIRFIPKRAISQQDCEFIRTLLKKNFGDF